MREVKISFYDRLRHLLIRLQSRKYKLDIDRFIEDDRFKIYTPQVNKNAGKRLDWKQMEPQGGVGMVKGVSRRIVVVKSPDPRVFEEAIFVVREDFAGEGGISSGDVLKEAQRVASQFTKSSVSRSQRFLSRLPAPAFAAAGAVATSLAFLAMRLVGVS